MIAINHIEKKEIEAIAQKHCGKIKPVVNGKIAFIRLYAQTLLYRANQTNRVEVYNNDSQNGNTKNNLLHKFFFIKKVTEVNHSRKHATPYYRTYNRGDPNALNNLQNLINICIWFEANLDNIISGSPEDLILLHHDCITNHSDAYFYLFNKKQLQFFFQYDDKLTTDTGYNGWNNESIVSALESKTCYYCNRQYTLAVLRNSDNKKLFMPQLDHFFDKKEYPILALSFYNLIPSCSNCNHKKSNNSFTLDNNIHPYIEGFDKDGYFSFKPRTLAASQGESEDIDILFHHSNSEKGRKVLCNVNELGLDEIYNKSHKDYVREMVKKKFISNDAYLNTLIKTYPKANLTLKEAYQLAFGNYLDESEFYKRPLAKLTKDIAIDINLIDP